MSRPALAAELASEHQTALYGFALRLSGDPSDAADLVQDTFERALRRLDGLSPGTNARAWLCTILHNLFVDRWRRQSAQPVHQALDERILELPQAEPEPLPAWVHLGPDQVWRAVGQLEEDLREAYLLHVADGLSYQEAGARLGIPASTVGTRLLRARRKLRELLGRPAAEEQR